MEMRMVRLNSCETGNTLPLGLVKFSNFYLLVSDYGRRTGKLETPVIKLSVFRTSDRDLRQATISPKFSFKSSRLKAGFPTFWAVAANLIMYATSSVVVCKTVACFSLCVSLRESIVLMTFARSWRILVIARVSLNLSVNSELGVWF